MAQITYQNGQQQNQDLTHFQYQKNIYRLLQLRRCNQSEAGGINSYLYVASAFEIQAVRH